MGIANKYNRGNKFINENEVPENAPFITLDKIAGVKEPIVILTMWINSKSQYGPHPVLGTATGKIDLPQSMTDTVREMMQDDEVIEAVNQKKLAFIPRQYTSKKYNKVCYTVDFVDVQ